MTGPDVVAAWGGFNGLLVAVLLIYGESAFAIVLYASVVLLIEIVAAVAWLFRHQGHEVGEINNVHKSRAPFFGGIAAFFIAAGFIFRPYFVTPAAYFLIAAALDATAHRREVRRERRRPEPPPKPTNNAGGRRKVVAKAATAGAVGLATGLFVSRRARVQPPDEAPP